MSTNVLTKPWVVAPPALRPDARDCDGEPVYWLRGKDYGHLCETCRAAIDQAAGILPEIEPWGRFLQPDDPEAPMMFALDHGWLCGGHECDCVREPEPEPIVAAMTVQSTTFRSGFVVVDEAWVILPIYGNGYDLGQLAAGGGRRHRRQGSPARV